MIVLIIIIMIILIIIIMIMIYKLIITIHVVMICPGAAVHMILPFKQVQHDCDLYLQECNIELRDAW